MTTPNEEVDDLYARLEAVTNERDALRVSLDEAGAENASLRAERDRLHESAEAWRAVAKEWETQNDALRAVFAALSEEHGQAGCDICECKADGSRASHLPAAPLEQVTGPTRSCSSCPHPPHTGQCWCRDGGTAYRCGCLRDTVGAQATGPGKETPDVG